MTSYIRSIAICALSMAFIGCASMRTSKTFVGTYLTSRSTDMSTIMTSPGGGRMVVTYSLSLQLLPDGTYQVGRAEFVNGDFLRGSAFPAYDFQSSSHGIWSYAKGYVHLISDGPYVVQGSKAGKVHDEVLLSINKNNNTISFVWGTEKYVLR